MTSVYGEGGIAAAMGSTMPVTANPTAQGLISVIAFAVNVFSFAYILKQADLRRAMEVLAHGIEAYNSRKL